MANGNTRGERLQIMLSAEELVALDDFRFKARCRAVLQQSGSY